MYGIPITPLGHLVHAVFPLLIIAVVLRRFGRGGDPNAAWDSKVDLSLAFGAGLTATLLSTAWMARYFVGVRPLTASDFGQYCESLAAFRSSALEGWIPQRSLVAGSVPGLFTESFGVVDSLLVGATLSHLVMAIGLYLWARAAHSRMAGVVAALISTTVAPLVHLSRTVTFYPETVAVCVLSAAGAVLSMRYRSLPAFAFSAVASGLVLLVDVRGLLWALPAVGITLVAALLAPRVHRKILGVVFVGAALAASHEVGKRTTWETSPSLELQTVYYVDEAIRRFQPDQGGFDTENYMTGTQFIWGRSGTFTIPQTLRFLVELRATVPDGIEMQHETAYSRRVHLAPWVVPGAVGLLLGVVGAFRRKWLAAALLGSVVPFAVALQGTSQMVSHSRYLANGITMIPVVLGIGMATVYWGRLRAEDSAAQRVLTRWDGLVFGLLIVVVLGMIPTWLSPVANWRAPVTADIEPANTLWHAANSSTVPVDVSTRCAEALQDDFTAGFPVGSRLLGWEVEESPVHNPTLEGE